VTELLLERAIPAGIMEPVGDGWTVHGRVVPFGVRQSVQDTPGAPTYLERFNPAAFARDVVKGGRWVNLMLGHRGDDGDRFLGRCVALAAAADGLYADFRLNRDHPLAEQARSGELTGWSMGARAYETRIMVDPDGARVTERVACGLNHVAATTAPQYAGAGVLVARDHQVLDDTPRTPIRDQLLARYRPTRLR
jgi:HK97 family phage prohead protease